MPNPEATYYVRAEPSPDLAQGDNAGGREKHPMDLGHFDHVRRSDDQAARHKAREQELLRRIEELEQQLADKVEGTQEPKDLPCHTR